MSALQQFVLNNLLPALVAGALAWATVWAGIHVLRVRHGKLRLCLFTAPLLKSTLVLLGLGMVLPWPRDLFGAWHAEALPPAAVIPFFLSITGATILGRSALVQRARRRALVGAAPADERAARLHRALDHVMDVFASRRAEIVLRCGCEPDIVRPDVRVTDEPLHSPIVIPDRRPTIVFPAGLIGRLSEAELEGAIAHEIAHTLLRDPRSCFSSETVKSLSVANPLAAAMAAQLHREEEKACDDLAVAAIGDADTYAGMLLTCYRYARETSLPYIGTLRYLPHLMGVKPMLSERIERLLDEAGPGHDMPAQYAAFGVLWVLIVAVFFST